MSADGDRATGAPNGRLDPGGWWCSGAYSPVRSAPGRSPTTSTAIDQVRRVAAATRRTYTSRLGGIWTADYGSGHGLVMRNLRELNVLWRNDTRATWRRSSGCSSRAVYCCSRCTPRMPYAGWRRRRPSGSHQNRNSSRRDRGPKSVWGEHSSLR